MEIYNGEINDVLVLENWKLKVHENIKVCFSCPSLFWNSKWCLDPLFSHGIFDVIINSIVVIEAGFGIKYKFVEYSYWTCFLFR